MSFNLAIFTGGYSAESNISKLSLELIYNSLNHKPFNLYVIEISKSNWIYHHNGQAIEINKNDFSVKLDDNIIHFLGAAFALHGPPAEDGRLQAYLEMMNIPFLGCGVLCSALTFDKAATKQFLSNSGIKMAKSILVSIENGIETASKTINNTLTYPIFVKPNQNGSSYGVSKVQSYEALNDALINGWKHDRELIIEEFIPGREFSIGVYNYQNKSIALLPTEIISETDFFDYEAKYLGKSKEVTPAELTQEQTQQIQYLGQLAYTKLGCEGLCRIDFILNGSDFYFLETNTIPGFTSESIVPQQIRAAGYQVSDFMMMLAKERFLEK